MAEKQTKRLKRLANQVFEIKQNKPNYLGGLLGAYKNGKKQVKSLTKPGYVYVRLGGSDSEIIEALNFSIPEVFNLKVLVSESETNPGIYVVVGRDLGQYGAWPTSGGALIHHGHTHSFGNGGDPVFVYKKQMAQPLQAHPTNPRSNALRVEGDFYIWNDEIKYFPGGNTTNLSAAKPPNNNKARWLTVYLDGDNNTLAYVTGTDFNLVTPFSTVPTGIVYYIPEVAPTVGIPLAAVYLTSGSTTFGWDDIQDVRNFLGGGVSGARALEGSPTTIPFFTGTSTLMTNPLFIFENSGNKMVIGNTGSISGFQAQIQIVDTDGQAGVTSIVYGGTGTNGPFFGGAYARGSPGAERAVPSGVVIFDISANGWRTGTSNNFISPPPMRITANTLQDWNTTDGYGNYWGFVVTPMSSLTRKESFRIYDNKIWIDGGEFRTTGSFFVNPIGAVSGQSLVYDGTNWVPTLITGSAVAGTNHSHHRFRYSVVSGTASYYLSGTVSEIEIVSLQGFIVDPLDYTLVSGTHISLSSPPVIQGAILTVNYLRNT